MKVITTKIIDEIEIIDYICDAKIFVDPEKTKQAIIAKGNILEDKTIAERKVLFSENAVYFDLQSHMEYIDDIEGEEIKSLLDGRQEKELLKLDKEIIKDERNKIYFILKDEKWKEIKIKKLDEEIPEGAIFQEDLTIEQRTEIYEQKEEERIESLTTEQREIEKNAKIDGLLGSVANYKMKLELEDSTETGFDLDAEIRSFYEDAKSVIVEKYDIKEVSVSELKTKIE